MKTARLEAFSDGVLAIVITIMVLELRAPHEPTLAALIPLWPIFLSYLLSFIYIAIYWNNHHHMFQAADHITGSVLWANMHLLFWLSLIPFTTAWMGENHFAAVPLAIYGLDLLLAAIAYSILQRSLIKIHGPDSTLAKAIGYDWKGKLSPVLYASAIALAFVHPAIAGALYAAVAVMWLIPDSRIEHALVEHDN